MLLSRVKQYISITDEAQLSCIGMPLECNAQQEQGVGNPNGCGDRFYCISMPILISHWAFGAKLT